MKTLYDHVSAKASKITTRSYSTSFSLGIRLFHHKYHDPIYAIYGFVRLADEIVDTFHEFDKKQLLQEFRDDTIQAIERGISLNPILQSFQEAVRTYNIDWWLIDRFLKSMEMDLDDLEYDQKLFEEYILGSAEVVGLMCLKVFTQGDEKKYKELEYGAMRLGSAFQKINFLRDLHADHLHLGRTYFPNLDLNNFDQSSKELIEADIEKDFREGLSGIRKLPTGTRYGVYVAYVYYHNLFKKIKRLQSEKLLEHKRIRVPNPAKYGMLVSSYLRYRLNLM
ncbi:MAG: squalene/phytoene synthase family protein [Bacteroidetes bacterium]|nr:squalene/phytoene synthase family protein [Bacteroidota bacterium]MBU2559034.1 squalene/phytoene synthase family protein [Bacteroidota bacterium]